MKNNKLKLKQFILVTIFLCGGYCLNAQETTTIKVSGTVTSAEGMPLIGVNIIEEGTSNGVISDFDGRYTITVSKDDILVFSYLGFKNEEIPVNGQSTIDIALEKDAARLGEVVVIGYGTTTRSDITTAVSTVDPADIPSSANQSVSELLFGRAAGLDVSQQSSQPGGNIDISIRGKGQPLIVVDGVVYPGTGLEPDNGNIALQGVNRGALAGINPNDIASIEILKDASAAIYGVAAANGVVLITTKKGTEGRMNISYNASHSFVQNTNYLEPLNARQYMTYYNQLSRDKYLADNNMIPFGSDDPSGFEPMFSAEEIDNAGVGTDWLGLLLRDGSIENHNISVSGGTERVRYYFSGNYFNQKGTVEGSDLEKFTGRLNVSFDLSETFTLNTSINANRNEYSNPQTGGQIEGGVQNFNALQASLAYPAYIPVRDKNGDFSQFGLIGNPVALLNIKDETKFNGMLANFSLDIDIIPEVLTGKLSYGNNKQNSVRDFYIPKTVFYNQQYRARASLAVAQRENETMEATLTFNKSFGDFVKIDAVAGVGQYIDKDNGFGVEAYDIEDAINTEALQNATGPTNAYSYTNTRKYRSFFARTSFDFLNRYLLTLTFRRDGADLFFPSNKYQNFPSASVGWKISNESFMKNADFVNLLKIRASYGLIGQRPTSLAYGAFQGDNTAITFNNGDVLYIPYRLTSFDNPNLQWPITKTFDVGLDFAFFKNRITGSFDWYKESLDRLLVNTTTPQLSFISSRPINAGSQERTGYELSLNTSNIRTPDFTWNTTFNFTHYENRWTERFPNDPPPQYGSVTDPLNIIYVYETEGILQIDQKVPEHQPEGARVPGSPIFVDQNNDGVLNFNDVISFSGIPKAVIGFGNNFQYKNFDLAIFLYGQFGAYGYDYTTAWGNPLNLLSGRQSGTIRIADAWSTSNLDGTYPGAAFNPAGVALDAGIDTDLAKKDFLRARNITVGYSFSENILDNTLQSLRLYVDIQNAFIITDYEGVDPETQASGVIGGAAPYPMARTISIGLNANF